MADPFDAPLPTTGQKPWSLNPAIEEVRGRVGDVEDYVSGPGLEGAISEIVEAGPLPSSTEISYDADGNVVLVTVGGVVTTYTYNTDGSVNTDTRGDVSRQYTYDDSGNLVSIEEIA